MKDLYGNDDIEGMYQAALAVPLGSIATLNEELRVVAVQEKGAPPQWDEYHSLAIRNIFELKRVAKSLVRLRDCVNSYYGDFTEERDNGQSEDR